MSVFPKIAMIFRYKRIIWGLMLIALVIYLVLTSFLKADTLSKDPFLSCRVSFNCSLPDILAVYSFEIVFIILAVFFIITGLKRLGNAVWVIEHGTVTNAVVGSASEILSRRKILKGFYTVESSWGFSCSFNTPSGKKSKLKVIAPEKDYLKKGETIDVIYDPEMPENALAIDALPGFVRTEPDLRIKHG